MSLNLPSSNLQVTMATALEAFRRLYLQQALAQTIKELELTALNAELDALAPADDLKRLASLGLRGEFLFPVPALLTANPRLLGYYRLLLGFSQKEFFNKGKLGRFKSMEEKGVISLRAQPDIATLCEAFTHRASELLRDIRPDRFSLDLLDDLTLLTLGPQLRGSNNTKIGKLANQAVFELIHSIVGHAVEAETATRLEIRNASKRKVVVAFSADPDISVVEEASKKSRRNIVAIEVKGGGDQSNIWNRLGEAEKSHQSAKQRGFVEFWTIYNVPALALSTAHEKSPTTNRFYNLRDLLVSQSEALDDFRDRLISSVGIAASASRT
ncbi:MAG: XcyI family restriction endonuclease [Chthoniobacterales bacterium]|nr:XcyI family restriction endonuclease [Chthoniobacterales bacterium]